MATVPTAASTTFPTHEERAHAQEQFQRALAESDRLNGELAELARQLRQEAEHVGE